MTPATLAVAAGLVVLCAFFAAIVAQHGLLFYREARGARKRSTLAGAAAVIAIIVSILVGTFTQRAPVLTPPPAQVPKPAQAPKPVGAAAPKPAPPP